MKNNNLEWTMKDGTSILIKDMDDRHLNNTIQFIERSLKESHLLRRRLGPYQDAMKEELKKRFYDQILKEEL